MKNIYLIKNVNKVFPDFNKKPTDAIAKIDVLNVYKSKDLENYLNKFVNNIDNRKVKADNTFYILRKGNLNEIL